MDIQKSIPESRPAALLTPVETCRHLNIGRTKLYELLNDGALKSITIGRARRILASSVDEFVAGRVA